MKLLKKTRFKVFSVSPKLIKYCIYPSSYCDYTQFTSSRLHPHAGIDRGVFKEENKGYIKINNSDWDLKYGVMFSNLLEFQALQNHYTGKENWKKSEFALRNLNYFKEKKILRGIRKGRNFLLDREKQIDKLFNSISKRGVYPANLEKKNNNLYDDNISTVLTKNNKLLFNNRGHHRLSIAKILNLNEIPIKITIAKSLKSLKKFLLQYG